MVGAQCCGKGTRRRELGGVVSLVPFGGVDHGFCGSRDRVSDWAVVFLGQINVLCMLLNL